MVVVLGGDGRESVPEAVSLLRLDGMSLEAVGQQAGYARPLRSLEGDPDRSGVAGVAVEELAGEVTEPRA